MKIIALMISFLLLTVTVNAEEVCQKINRTGTVDNAPALAKSMNKLLKSKGVKYRTTSKEISNLCKKHCKTNPADTADDLTNLLIKMSDVLASAGG